MATLEEEDAQRKRLLQLLEELSAIKPEALVREDVLGRDLSFAQGLPYFSRTLRLFHDLGEVSLDTIPHNVLNQLSNMAQQARKQFGDVQNFSLQQHPQNPTQVRDSLIQTIRDSYDTYFQHISPVIAYAVRKGTDFERLEMEARESVEKLRGIVSEQQASRAAMLSEIEGTLERVRRAAQEVGVAQHSVHFKQEADDHKSAASKWLWATAILSGVAILFGIGSVVYYIRAIPTLSGSQSIQLAVAKLIIFSTLISAVIWSGRIYRAHRHNYIVNKHRQNALSTFETFAKAANDDQTKSAVLLQATQCIFSPQQSGYVAQESEAAGYSQVLEIIRNASGSQPKS